MYKLVFLLLIINILACQKAENAAPQQPQISVSSVLNTGNNSVQVGIDLIKVPGNLIVDYGIVWAETPLPTVNDSKLSKGKAIENESNNSTLSNFTIGKTYFFRAYFIFNNIVTYSDATSIIVQNNSQWSIYPTIPISNEMIPTKYMYLANGIMSVVLKSPYTEEVQIWEYTFYRNNWAKNQNATLPMRYSGILLSLGGSFNNSLILWGGGYYLINNQKVFLKDFYKNAPFTSGQQEERTDFPGANVPLESFNISVKGYVLETTNNVNLWQYDDNLLIWRQKKPLPVANFNRAVTFGSDVKGYAMLEYSTSKTLDFYEYDPLADKWTKKANFPGVDRTGGVGFSLGGRVFYGTGQSKDKIQGLRDIWEYNVLNDSWKRSTDYAGRGNINLVAQKGNDRNEDFETIGLGFQTQTSTIGTGIYAPATDIWSFIPN